MYRLLHYFCHNLPPASFTASVISCLMPPSLLLSYSACCLLHYFCYIIPPACYTSSVIFCLPPPLLLLSYSASCLLRYFCHILLFPLMALAFLSIFCFLLPLPPSLLLSSYCREIILASNMPNYKLLFSTPPRSAIWAEGCMPWVTDGKRRQLICMSSRCCMPRNLWVCDSYYMQSQYLLAKYIPLLFLTLSIIAHLATR